MKSLVFADSLKIWNNSGITGWSSWWNSSPEDSFFGGQIHLDGWIATRIIDLTSVNLLDGHDEVDKSTYALQMWNFSNDRQEDLLESDLQMNLAADKMAFALDSSFFPKIEKYLKYL